MKTKQLNFYLLATDILLIEQYLKNNDFVFGAYPMPKQTIIEADSLAFFDENVFSSKKIFMKNQLDALFFEKLDEKFWLNDLYSPLISYHHGFFDVDRQILQKGRFYYQTGFYDQNGLWKEKNKEFVDAAQKFFTWFKKNFKKSESAFDNYTSEAVLDFIKKGGTLKQF